MRMHKHLSAERLSHKHDVYPQELTQLLMEKISRRSCLLTPLRHLLHFAWPGACEGRARLCSGKPGRLGSVSDSDTVSEAISYTMIE